MNKVLETSDLSKRYGAIQAVQNLSLVLPQGSVYGLLGPNGSGKTTTLGMVLGVTEPSSGSFKWFEGSHDRPLKKRIGALLETPNFYPYLSARENLKLVATIKGLEEPNIDEALESVHLLSRAESTFRTFSLGMKQRLAIASTMLGQPECLILDEPTNGLDPQGIAEVRAIIQSIAKKGITVLLASHILVEVEKLCGHVAVLNKGHLLYNGPVQGMRAEQGLLELTAEDNHKLQEKLSAHPDIGQVRLEGSLVLANLKGAANAQSINQYLCNNGVYVKHLVERKHSLEENFLELIHHAV